MDHLIVELLNTAAGTADPLETPLGTARWWGSLPRLGLPVDAGKPRFDGALAVRVRELRGWVSALVSGAATAVPMPFRGDGSDGVLFELLQAICAAFSSGTLERIRQCRGQACGRYFLDETKNGSRRWCSLRCMERARAPRRRTIAR